MKTFQSILVVVPSHKPQRQIQNIVQNALDFGRWLHCEVHLLTGISEGPPTQIAIAKVRHKKEKFPSTLIIHPTAEKTSDRILESIQKYSCGLVIMEDGTLLYQHAGTEERRTLELSPSPVLLIPKHFDFKRRPPGSFLVPLSGEQRTSEALAVSLQLADQTELPVDFLHVTIPGEPCTCDQTYDALGDQLHHEYHEMIEKIISETSPYSTPEERKQVRHFFHCAGFTSTEIITALKKATGAILVLEWKGTLARGHAKTIKAILQKTHVPTLFVRRLQEQKSTLRVAKKLIAA